MSIPVSTQDPVLALCPLPTTMDSIAAPKAYKQTSCFCVAQGTPLVKLSFLYVAQELPAAAQEEDLSAKTTVKKISVLIAVKGCLRVTFHRFESLLHFKYHFKLV